MALAALMALSACGGSDGDPTSPTATPPPESTATDATDSTGGSDEESAAATLTDEPVADIAVEVEPFGGDYEDTDTAAIHEAFTAFETALWETFAASEITNELRVLAGPDVIGGLEQSIADQPQPLGGTVTVTATVENVVITDMGGGPVVTEADLDGCSDHTQVEYESGNGNMSGFSASVVFEDGFVVQEYILGTEAC